MAVALLFRLLLPIRRQWQMRFDVKQAQKVQQVILPEAEGAAGLVIKSDRDRRHYSKMPEASSRLDALIVL